MILSRRRRFIFIHIPKTGGTSFALAYEARAAKDDILIGDTPKAKRRRTRIEVGRARGRLWKHSTLSDIRGLATDDEIADFFVMTLVRNPWDRMFSYWAWLRQQSFAHPAVALAKANGFGPFLRHEATRKALRANPYGSYVRGPDGAERCDAFVRLEHLEDDLAAVESHLGFALGQLPFVNASAAPIGSRAAYDDELAELIAEAAEEDIRRFRYNFRQK
jgi:hypothetical protein